MKYLRKKTKLVLMVVVLLLLIPAISYTAQYKATDASSLLGDTVKPTGVSGESVETLLNRVVKSVFALVGTLFFIFIFYGGFKWLVARGNEEEITKAKNTVIASIIGLVIIIASYAITNFIFTQVVEQQTGGSTGAKIPDAVEGEEVGCCLDKWASEGGYFGVGQSGWVGKLLTKKQCGALTNDPDYPGQKIGSDWGDWVSGVTSIKKCQEAAKLKEK